MHLALPTILSTWAALATICISQTVVQDHGSTTKPPAGEVIPHGHSFPFAYKPVPFGRHVCFSVYDPVAIYLSTSPPTDADITVNRGTCALTDDSFIHDFGHYVIARFGQY